MPDIEAVQAAVRRANAQRGPSPAELAAHRQMQGMVTLRMDHLLQADEWETFRLHLDARAQQAQAALDIERDKVERGDVVGDEAAKATLRMRCLRERLDTYAEVLALPGLLIEQGKSADSDRGSQ